MACTITRNLLPHFRVLGEWYLEISRKEAFRSPSWIRGDTQPGHLGFWLSMGRGRSNGAVGKKPLTGPGKSHTWPAKNSGRQEVVEFAVTAGGYGLKAAMGKPQAKALQLVQPSNFGN
jgi:hypothetical protein